MCYCVCVSPCLYVYAFVAVRASEDEQKPANRDRDEMDEAACLCGDFVNIPVKYLCVCVCREDIHLRPAFGVNTRAVACRYTHVAAHYAAFMRVTYTHTADLNSWTDGMTNLMP